MSYGHALKEALNIYTDEADWAGETFATAKIQDLKELSDAALLAAEETNIGEHEKLLRDLGRLALRIMEVNLCESHTEAWALVHRAPEPKLSLLEVQLGEGEEEADRRVFVRGVVRDMNSYPKYGQR